MEQAAVFRLETYRFDKLYRRFICSNPDTFPDFHPDKDEPDWIPPKLAATWVPQKLIGDVWPENDFPGAGAPAYLTPIFSPRAVDGLREFLEFNGELLPVTTPLGTYYAYNLTTLVDAIDPERSDIKYWPGSDRIHEVSAFVLEEKALKGQTIFRFPQIPVEIFITEPFVRRVEKLKLNGMWITKCWPMPPGVRWLAAWNEVLNQKRQAEQEEQTTQHQERQKAAKKPARRPDRSPHLLDLRKDVATLERLLKRTMKWIKGEQKGWITKLEAVSAIGLEVNGWDLEDGPLVLCNVDTREVHGKDGHWSHFDAMQIKMPQWSALMRAVDESKDDRVVIDVRGKTHNLAGNADSLGRRFGEILVAAMEQAKANGVFKALRDPQKCTLSIEDPDSDFWWPVSGEPEVLAG